MKGFRQLFFSPQLDIELNCIGEYSKNHLHLAKVLVSDRKLLAENSNIRTKNWRNGILTDKSYFKISVNTFNTTLGAIFCQVWIRERDTTNKLPQYFKYPIKSHEPFEVCGEVSYTINNRIRLLLHRRKVSFSCFMIIITHDFCSATGQIILIPERHLICLITHCLLHSTNSSHKI